MLHSIAPYSSRFSWNLNSIIALPDCIPGKFDTTNYFGVCFIGKNAYHLIHIQDIILRNNPSAHQHPSFIYGRPISKKITSLAAQYALTPFVMHSI